MKLLAFFQIEKEFEALSEMLECQEAKTFKPVRIERPSMNSRLRRNQKALQTCKAKEPPA